MIDILKYDINMCENKKNILPIFLIKVLHTHMFLLILLFTDDRYFKV